MNQLLLKSKMFLVRYRVIKASDNFNYLVDVLIKDHITRLYDEFKTLLEQDKIEDMSRLYCLVKKTENHRNRADEESILDPMRKSFQDHIATQGQSYKLVVHLSIYALIRYLHFFGG